MIKLYSEAAPFRTTNSKYFTSHKTIFSLGLSMKKIVLFYNKKERKRWIKQLKVDIISWLLVSWIFCLLLLVVKILSCLPSLPLAASIFADDPCGPNLTTIFSGGPAVRQQP